MILHLPQIDLSIYVAWNIPAFNTLPLRAPPRAGPIDKTFTVMRFDTELGLSPKLAAILFLDGCFFPGGTGIDSTLLISSIHFRIVSTLKFPIDCL